MFEESQSWDFSQQGGQHTDFTFTSAIDLVNSSEISTKHQNSNTTSHAPSYEQSDQGQLSEEEERLERYKLIQSIYEETRGAEEEICFISREEPSSYESEVKEEIWRQALREEMEAVEKNSTWELVKPFEKCRPIGVKWIYKIKRNSTREITRYKARLVAKGYSKKRGIDYDEVFSPVARAEFIQIVIALAAQFKWNLHHLDVKSAFLNGKIEEEIYVDQPAGFIKEGKEDYVLKLKKALYGLKQAPRACNCKLDNTLKSMDFIKCVNDQAVYTSSSKEHRLLLGFYVDDLIITGSNTGEIEVFKSSMKTKFDIADFGFLNSFLGIEVIQGKLEIKI